MKKTDFEKIKEMINEIPQSAFIFNVDADGWEADDGTIRLFKEYNIELTVETFTLLSKLLDEEYYK